MIYTTPLQTWNPYKLKWFDGRFDFLLAIMSFGLSFYRILSSYIVSIKIEGLSAVEPGSEEKTKMSFYIYYNIVFLNATSLYSDKSGPTQTTNKSVRRSGGSTKATAYLGISSRIYSMTPVEFFGKLTPQIYYIIPIEARLEGVSAQLNR